MWGDYIRGLPLCRCLFYTFICSLVSLRGNLHTKLNSPNQPSSFKHELLVLIWFEVSLHVNVWTASTVWPVHSLLPSLTLLGVDWRHAFSVVFPKLQSILAAGLWFPMVTRSLSSKRRQIFTVSASLMWLCSHHCLPLIFLSCASFYFTSFLCSPLPVFHLFFLHPSSISSVPRVVAVSPQMRLVEDNPSSLSLVEIYKQRCAKKGIEHDNPISRYYDRLATVQARGTQASHQVTVLWYCSVLTCIQSVWFEISHHTWAKLNF